MAKGRDTRWIYQGTVCQTKTLSTLSVRILSISFLVSSALDRYSVFNIWLLMLTMRRVSSVHLRFQLINLHLEISNLSLVPLLLPQYLIFEDPEVFIYLVQIVNLYLVRIVSNVLLCSLLAFRYFLVR